MRLWERALWSICSLSTVVGICLFVLGSINPQHPPAAFSACTKVTPPCIASLLQLSVHLSGLAPNLVDKVSFSKLQWLEGAQIFHAVSTISYGLLDIHEANSHLFSSLYLFKYEFIYVIWIFFFFLELWFGI